MEKEFVSYKESLELKELGFNEPCIAIYYSKDKSFSWHHHKDHTNDEPVLDSGEFNISAPLYQQAFRWFREKYILIYVIVKAESWFFTINGCNTQEGFNTYEEAELECLRKLIEIVKENG